MCKTCTGEIRVRHTKICACACWSGQLSRDVFLVYLYQINVRFI